MRRGELHRDTRGVVGFPTRVADWRRCQLQRLFPVFSKVSRRTIGISAHACLRVSMLQRLITVFRNDALSSKRRGRLWAWITLFAAVTGGFLIHTANAQTTVTWTNTSGNASLTNTANWS